MHAASLICLLALAAPPKVLDDRLVLELVAEEPRIVTPTGIAVDERGRVFVIECHTHFRPKDYQGPPADRVRVFEDADGDGKYEKVSNFYEGTSATMGIALASPTKAYLITRNDLRLLEDTDDDGKADKETMLVKLETKGNYPHNGLCGITFDPVGNLVFGLGENLGEPYKLVAADGAALHGGGEGGNVYRCRPDGTKLEQFATGFWNPFGLSYDAFGNLFCVDNDPDSRPPCRLMHVVAGGDFGYKFSNGRKGTHPFTAWDGELPGTLPMVCGVGEAPSGVLAYEAANLPADYLGKLIVPSWGDYRIDVVTPVQRGASIGGELKTFVQGGEDFRPTCLALGPDGSIFFTDWVKRDYPIHGRGRVWRLRAKQPGTAPAIKPGQIAATKDEKQLLALAAHPHVDVRRAAARQLIAQTKPDPVKLNSLVAAGGPIAAPRGRLEVLWAAYAADGKLPPIADKAGDDVAFRAEVARLGDDSVRETFSLDAKEPPALLMARLERLWKLGGKSEEVKQLLTLGDPFLSSAAVRLIALMPESAPERQALQTSDQPELRLAWLLAWRKSSEGRWPRQAVLAPPAGAPPVAGQSNEFPYDKLARFFRDPDPQVRRTAIKWAAEAGFKQLLPQIEAAVIEQPGNADVFYAYLAARQMLSGEKAKNPEEFGDVALGMFLDARLTPELRRLALRATPAGHGGLKADQLLAALQSGDTSLATEAAWALREAPRKEAIDALAKLIADEKADPELRADCCDALAAATLAFHGGVASGPGELLTKLAADEKHPLARHAKRLLRPKPAVAAELSPERMSAIRAALAQPGDVRNGRRVFFQAGGVGCASCHKVDGRGQAIGPELTKVAGQLTPERLLASLVEPSKEVAPQFVPWQVTTVKGQAITGVQVGRSGDSITLADAQGKKHVIKFADMEEIAASPKSIMPDGLLSGLADEDIRDLAAFLQTLK